MAKKTTKTKKSAAKLKASDLDFMRSPRKDQLDPRKKLLARIAGNVAAGIVQAPSEATSSASAIAEMSADIAEQILLKVGLEAPAAPDPDLVA